MGFLGSLFESKSSSSTSSSQTTNNTSIDKRVVADNGGFAVSGDTVNVLDGKAIERAFTFSTDAVAASFDFAKTVGQERAKTVADVLGASERQGALIAAGLSTAYDNAKGEGTQKTALIAAALVVVAIVGLRAWKQ